ncbi:uncharacterized protein FTJAE_7881 [Fusarium tjaetaba]|uniref:Uncharacterized protein n=1 Tax=Fusarium tjaetaba TaxID=1567544 RepID=A0A8H5RE81_9HYPO|nr:uncharacterized protein FTJAE_7881 [Fusarium tjaetaba]KAF5631478.1 hypothetical protein FTJAE_7881 [Fusarium tjaetaba]
MDSISLSDWLSVTSAGDTSFGHYKYEPSHSPTHEMCLWNFSRVFSALGWEVSAHLMTYAEWLKLVRDSWSSSEPFSEADRTTFVFEIDPEMSVSCALALWVSVHAAAEIAPGNVTRMLTVSYTDVDQAFVRLVEHYGYESPRLFTHINRTVSDTEPEDVRTIYCASKSELNRKAIERIESLQGKQIVVDIAPCYLAKILDLDDSWKHISVDSDDIEMIWKVFYGTFEENIVLRVLPGFCSPFPLHGYDHVHVIAESNPTTLETDMATNQLTFSTRQWSIQERQQVRTHLRRFGTKPSTTAFYVDRPKREDANLEWWDDGPALRRQIVWSLNLGAFIAAVTSLGSKVDAAAVVQCFVPEGIINLEQDGHLTMNLEGRELTAFAAVLPWVSYDYRLAYLIAQESETEDDEVLQVKIQLAAVISVGGLSLFDFDKSLDDPEPADTLEAVIEACTGNSASLGDEGNMWLALGLWNRVGKDSVNFSQVPDSDSVPISGISVRANWSSCVQVHELWKGISSALAANGIHTVRRELTTETQALSRNGCRAIGTHLFKAYLSQLVMRGPWPDEVEFLDVSTRRTITGFVSKAGMTLDSESIQPSYVPVFGIYHHLIRLDGKVCFKDWTRVCPRIVDDWILNNRDRSGEYESVIETYDKDETLPRPDYDEYN